MSQPSFRLTLGSTALALALTVATAAVAQDHAAHAAPKPAATPAPAASATPAPAASTMPAPATTAAPAPAGTAMAAPATAANTPPPPVVGGAPMLPTNTIVQNASAASNLTTLVELVKLAGLDGTLAGPGPFTVFAPDNSAFAGLPAATVTALKAPEHKATLTKVLTYHVVPGTLSFADLKKQVTDGGGTATLTTVAGVPLTAQLFPIAAGGETVMLTGANGGKSYVTIADVKQANGMVHVVNGVLSPDK